MRARAHWIGVVGLALAPRADAGVVINELFADAASVDANCDGLVGTQDDELVEIVNLGPNDVDLSGATLSDALAVQHTFAAGTVLAPYEAIVVFGGGTPQLDGTSASPDPWCVALPASVRVVVSTSGGLGLNNSGDTITLADAAAVVLDAVVYGSEGNADKSLVRDPELTGAVFVQHPGSPVSPGTMVGGGPFAPPPPDTGIVDSSPLLDTAPPLDTAPLLDTAPPAGNAGLVVINEVVVGVAGADDGYEWVELLNVGPTDIDLAGWTLERATTGSYGVRYTFPTWVLAPGQRVVVGEALVTADLNLPPGSLLAFGNATSNSDAVRLVDGAGAIADTVVYGSPNTDGFLDDSGLVATSLAPTPVDGSSLARLPDGSDTDASGTDFVLATPSPGADNAGVVDTGGDTATPVGSAGELVINELMPAIAGTDDGHEWIEVLNVGATDVDLADWSVERATTGSFGVRYTFPTRVLAPGERLVLGEELVAADLNLAAGTYLALGNAGSNSDAVRLVDPFGVVADTVVYGSPNTEGIVDDSGAVATSLAPTPSDDIALARLPDGSDTDASGVDFLSVAGTPGAVNVEPVIDTADTGDTGYTAPFTPSPSAGDVLINELLVNPTDLGADGTHEWVELVNVSGGAIDLTGWAIERAKSTWSVRHTFTGTVLQPGDRLLLGESDVPNADINLAAGETLDFGNATSDGDAVRLVDAAGLPVDTVIYGVDNANGFLDDLGQVAVSVAPKMGDDESIARVPDGADTNDSGVDFWLTSDPTPGATNVDPRDLCADGAEAAGVVVNEFDTSTTGAEWVEVYNGSGGAVDVSRWKLAHGTSSFSSSVELPDGTVVDAGGFLVVGAIPEAAVSADLAMGNASSSSDGLRLEDCVGGVVDTVVYGSPNTDAFVDDSGEVATSLAPKPASGSTVARISDGHDTNRSADDFVLQIEVTPGGPNPDVEPIVCEPSTGVVTINEILPDPEDTDDGREWIELYNSGSAEVSVAGWTISAGTKDFDDMSITIPGGTTIPAGGWLVVGGEAVDEADVEASFSLGNGTSGDGVRLFDCEGAAVDTVLYGESGEDGLPDDNDVPAEPYGDPESGESLARITDGVDTDAAEDWDSRGSPTPGASNVVQGGGGSYEAPGGGCGCGRGGPPENQDPGSGEAPGQGGCSTAPLPLGGFEALVALLAIVRRRRMTPAGRP